MNKKQVLLAMIITTAAAATQATTVDFSKGAEGFWGDQPRDSNGGTSIDTTLGNGAPALHTVLENFGVSWGTSTNQAFIGDYTKMAGVTLGIDVLTNSIDFYGQQVTRDLVVELRDYDNKPDYAPFTAVWYGLGTLDASKPGWQHLSVTIANTKSNALPTGWGGYGAEDAFDNPVLPDGRTFASVLAGVDEIVFTTLKPGYGYDYSVHDIAVDNISIAAVPEPATYGMMLGGLGLVGWVARRKQRTA